MTPFKFLLPLLFLFFLLFSQTKCSKTKDIEIASNLSDSTNNDTTIVIVASDTVYVSINSGFVLNEVLYDPPSGAAGDANNDGIRDANDDEFVEFVNNTNSCIDISKCRIFDNSNLSSGVPNHQFPDSTFINPNQGVVVFGGGTANGQFGGALVFISSNGVMNLNNGSSTSSGDKMTFTDSSGNVLIEFDIDPLSNSPDESYTRSPDLTGDFVQHNGVSSTLFSPGTKIDGSSF